jgi:hypothetical protein
MKNKLRKITIDDLEYLYSTTTKYNLGTNTNRFIVRIYLSNEKKTPLIIDFLTIDDFYIGQPLNTGIDVINKITNKVDRLNLNEPKYIRKLILHGRKNGWNGLNKISKQNGLDYLIDFGYEIDSLKPK